MISNRTEYMGIHVTKKVKKKLLTESRQKGLSLSSYVSRLIDTKEDKDLLKDIQLYFQTIYEYADDQEDIEDFLNRIRLRI